MSARASSSHQSRMRTAIRLACFNPPDRFGRELRYGVGIRALTAADIRRIALCLEGVEECPRAGLPAFRVSGRKFASLASQAEGYGNLMLTLEQQAAFVEEAPEIFLADSLRLGKDGTHAYSCADGPRPNRLGICVDMRYPVVGPNGFQGGWIPIYPKK